MWEGILPPLDQTRGERLRPGNGEGWLGFGGAPAKGLDLNHLLSHIHILLGKTPTLAIILEKELGGDHLPVKNGPVRERWRAPANRGRVSIHLLHFDLPDPEVRQDALKVVLEEPLDILCLVLLNRDLALLLELGVHR